MAKYVSDKLPDATDLEIAFSTSSSMSQAPKTMVESIDIGTSKARRNGSLQNLNQRITQKEVLLHKKLSTIAIPWGDLVTDTAPEYQISQPISRCSPEIQQLERFGWMTNLLKFKPLQKLALNYIDRNITGPDEQTRENAKSYVWAKASNPNGETVEAWLETPETYKLTVHGALRCVERVLDSELVGTHTPAGAFGADLILDLPESKRYDEHPS